MTGADKTEGTTQAAMLFERLVPMVPFGLAFGDADACPVGFPADRPDLHPDPDDLIVAVAAGLRSLHDIPVDAVLGQPDAPADWLVSGWEAVLDRCRSGVADGHVIAEALPEPYCRYSEEQLLAMAIEGGPGPSDDDELSVCHGAPTLERCYVDGGRFTGFDRFDSAIVADRHLDLAVVHQSVTAVFGPEAVFRFYESYGRDPNLARLERYVLVSHLTGALGPAGERP